MIFASPPVSLNFYLWQFIAVSLSGLAIAVTSAPTLGLIPVVVASLIWFVAVFFGIPVMIARSFKYWSAAHTVFLVGAGLPILRMSSLGLVQWLADRPSLFWNVDWRYHATHAHGIARFLGGGDVLDLAGEPLRYHAGPSWIAGALHAVVGMDLNWVLFVLFPVAAVATLVMASIQLLRAFGVRLGVAMLSVALVINLPSGLYRIADRARDGAGLDVFSNPELWWFTPSLMLNSLLGLSIGVVAAALVFDKRSDKIVRAVGGLALGALFGIKPQFFVGVVAAGMLGFVFNKPRSTQLSRWTADQLVVVVSLAVGALAFLALGQESPVSFVRLGVNLMGWASKVAIARHADVVLAVLLLGVAIVAGRARDRPGPVMHMALFIASGTTLLVLALEVTTFHEADSVVETGRAVGLFIESSSNDGSLSQAIVPATFFLLLFVTAFGADQLGSPKPRLALATFGILFAVPISVSPIIEPTGPSAYEWTDEHELHSIIADVGPSQGLWVSTDLADPAQDFARPLRAVNLTSLSPVRFYVSNARYNIGNPIVAERVADTRRFVMTPWSAWHSHFVGRNGIEYALIRDRCPPAWSPDSIPGSVVVRRGAWTVVRFEPPQKIVRQSDQVPAGRLPDPREPRYGLSACL